VTENASAVRERARVLMMAALDDEISPEERRELDGLTAGSPELRDEWRRLSRVKEVTTGMTLNTLPEETWDRYWVSVYARAERGVAWALLSAGAVVLIAYGLWHAVGALMTDPSSPAFVRIALVAILTGGAILVLSVVRERLAMWRRDPYSKEIVR
jgi:ferric-dicitrate binding protein FerR (iron transport regulator)